MPDLSSFIKKDQERYKKKYLSIQESLNGSTGIIDGVILENEEDIFYMLMFCLCVPQSKAVQANKSIQDLRQNDFYNKRLCFDQVLSLLLGRVRFQKIKTQRLLDAKKIFFNGFFERLTSFYMYAAPTPKVYYIILCRCRDWLVKSVNGMGMKVASHFMRNIGFRSKNINFMGLAILDVHILNCMKERRLIPENINIQNYNKYKDVEIIMRNYSQKVGMKIEELDLLYWSEKTGYVFK